MIFHAVEQLKVLQVEETQTVTELSSATTLPMKHQQSLSTTPEGISVTTTVTKAHDKETEISQLSSTPMNKILNQDSSETSNLSEVVQHVESSPVSVVFNSDDHEESPEVNEEMVEINYESPATPETNHESPEVVQETQEFNQEFPEKSEEEKFLTVINSSVNFFSEAPIIGTSLHDVVLQQQLIQTSMTDEMLDDKQKKKKPTIDSVVDEIYGIVKTTSSPFIEDMSDESKSITELSIEKIESIEDEEDETR